MSSVRLLIVSLALVQELLALPVADKVNQVIVVLILVKDHNHLHLHQPAPLHCL